MRPYTARVTEGNLQSFSPVAGIQWVETFSVNHCHDRYNPVSVPLPGFSGLRPKLPTISAWVKPVSVPLPGFSGLRRGDETLDYEPIVVSVPLPGFSGLRQVWGYKAPLEN